MKNETASGQNSDHQAFDVDYISYTNILETILSLQTVEQFSTFMEYAVRHYKSHHGYPHVFVIFIFHVVTKMAILFLESCGRDTVRAVYNRSFSSTHYQDSVAASAAGMLESRPRRQEISLW